MKIGLVINPLAGIGGSVALKGSDGEDIVARAKALGGRSQSLSRTKVAFNKLTDIDECVFYTAAGDMGETVLKERGFSYRVTYNCSAATSGSMAAEDTTTEDTKASIRSFLENSVDLIVFAGGDGTARDVLDTLSDKPGAGRSGPGIPVIGIPAGVKIHSAVYAATPSHAGELINMLISGEPMSVADAQVMDLDEVAFRDGKVTARCYGYLKVPVDDTRMQLIKQGGVNHKQLAVQDIAEDIVEEMDPDVVYLVGSGSTTAGIMDLLDLQNTLLGVDIVCDRELLHSDADEKTILRAIQGRKSKIIVTMIGGQGHIFGRGNQQFSAQVIRQVGLENIIIIASNEKLHSLNKRPMLTDTGDSELDDQLAGLHQVITGYQQKTLYRLN
jgi:predicted polyphosphate/ATP-dependent NAD kinase